MVSVSGWGPRLAAAALVAVLTACSQGTEANDTQEQDASNAHDDGGAAVEEEQQEALDDGQEEQEEALDDAEEAAADDEAESSKDPQLAEECEGYLGAMDGLLEANGKLETALEPVTAEDFEPGSVDDELADFKAAIEDYQDEVESFEHPDLQEIREPLVEFSDQVSGLYQKVYGDGEVEREEEVLEVLLGWNAVELVLNEMCGFEAPDLQEQD